MIIAMGLYQRFTALDAIGPYEVLTYLPDAEVVICAEHTGLVDRQLWGDETSGRCLESRAVPSVRTVSLADQPAVVAIPGASSVKHSNSRRRRRNRAKSLQSQHDHDLAQA